MGGRPRGELGFGERRRCPSPSASLGAGVPHRAPHRQVHLLQDRVPAGEVSVPAPRSALQRSRGVCTPLTEPRCRAGRRGRPLVVFMSLLGESLCPRSALGSLPLPWVFILVTAQLHHPLRALGTPAREFSST